MKMKRVQVLPLLLFLVLAMPLSSRAGQVLVGIGFAIPPYVIKDHDSGVEVDLIREAFMASGHDVEFVYLPNLRLPVAFSEGSVDCIATNAAYDLAADAGIPAYGSEETVVFQNFAVALKEKEFTIERVEDLAGKSVLGFNNAVKYLGPRFAAMAATNEQYEELADQALQVRMLYSGRVEVVISDKRIFRYWRMRLVDSPVADAVDLDQKVMFHSIFPAAPRHVAFREAGLRDEFNRGLALVRESGLMDAIEKKYADIEIGQ